MRLTRDIPTFHGEFTAGTVVEVYSVTLLRRGRVICGTSDISILEPVSDPAEFPEPSEPLTKPWAGMNLPPQPTLEEIRALRSPSQAEVTPNASPAPKPERRQMSLLGD